MGCIVALFALIGPRVALFVVWIFSDWLSRAFESWWLPVLGFFLLPWTTLAYTAMYVLGTNEVTGIEWFFVVLGFLIDIGAVGSGRRARQT
jgi:hypothetical protein